MKTILFDTDPGGDDAVALLWLAALANSGRIRLAAVTTVAGNVDGTLTFANAERLLAAGGITNVEIARAVAERGGRAQHVHGEDGLAGLADQLPAAAQSISDARAADIVICECLNDNPGEVDVIAVGPLSNLAAAEGLQPGVLGLARSVIIMGGAIGTGNVTPYAEFNVHFDATAAARVLQSGTPVTWLTLNTTNALRANDTTFSAPEEASAARIFLARLCAAMSALAFERTADGRGFAVHDAAAVGLAVCPELFELETLRLEIESDGPRSGELRAAPDGHESRVVSVADRNALFARMRRDFASL